MIYKKTRGTGANGRCEVTGINQTEVSTTFHFITSSWWYSLWSPVFEHISAASSKKRRLWTNNTKLVSAVMNKLCQYEEAPAADRETWGICRILNTGWLIGVMPKM